MSVAMTYAMISSYGKGKRSISAACAVLRGFHHKYPLTNDERKHLQLLIACRLALSATMGNYSYKQNRGPNATSTVGITSGVRRGMSKEKSP